MTFEEAREAALSDFDIKIQNLRDIISDPLWTNTNYRDYKECLDEIKYAINRINRLNNAEQENARPT